MSGPQSPVPTDHPMMIAWEKYKAGDDYGNSFKWAEHEQYRAGSMWAAFVAGWEASAPPAASADERLALARFLEPWAWLRLDRHGRNEIDGAYLRERSLSLADQLHDAGYRKLAPAQSVGQSAAQGVEEFAEELAKWCDGQQLIAQAEADATPCKSAHPELEAKLRPIVVESIKGAYYAVAAHIRRLSALPKGQDDEG